LRVHDDEVQSLVWCSNLLKENEGQKRYPYQLASTGRDRLLVLWDILNGNFDRKIKLPKEKNDKGEKQKSRIWICLGWSQYLQKLLVTTEKFAFFFFFFSFFFFFFKKIIRHFIKIVDQFMIIHLKKTKMFLKSFLPFTQDQSLISLSQLMEKQ